MNDRSDQHRSTKLVWCTWCGFASYDDVVCDRCGSPMIERPRPQIVALRLGRVVFGNAGAPVTKGCFCGTAAAGGLKWILVIGKLASFGAWIGLLLLLAIAILESVDRLGLV